MSVDLDSSTPLERAAKPLRDVFGFAELRPGQARALEPILAGRDTLVVMPTGAGKSLCYQLPALLGQGLTLVISPLIALMKDQVDGLRALGIAAAAINSSLAPERFRAVLEDLRAGALQLLYAAPERLGSRVFLEAIAPLDIARVAVDEAHCVSTWGHDFRPDYLRIEAFLERLGRPQTLALTATATPLVRADITAALGLRDPAAVVTGFERPNLALAVVRARGVAQRRERLIELFADFDSGAGAAIVYGGSRRGVEQAAADLRAGGHPCEVYHAGLEAAERTRVQESFLEGAGAIVVATNAFGMGIDRADVRLVAHIDLPGSLEAYYQEVGRAGRDGQPARGVLIFSEASVRLQEFFIDMTHPEPALVQGLYERLCAAAERGELAPLEELEEGARRSDRARVQAALNRLIGLGLAVRTGPEGLPAAILPPPGDPVELLDGRELRRRREIDELKLSSMLAYARGRGCRRDVILDYFEAEFEGRGCGRCDVCCAAQSSEADGGERELDEDEVIEARKILSAVARARGRAGRNKIVAMLVGSRSKEIAGTWLERLSTYGILAGMRREDVFKRIETLIDAALVDVHGDRYPVLALSARGRAAMLGSEPLRLSWPQRAQRRRAAAPAAALEIGDEDRDLAGRLRAWRRAEAARRALPAYRIFPDRTLVELAARRPANLEELARVHGMGPQRVSEFGCALLELIEG